ncbi:hypothetical protein [Nocardioides rubriscoriae]|uniref:hypothetical protein n=1 Tax=Nocardioides rubriscoriae TaxID=642762 RepID=UPI0011DF4920|nr:hypothetical protein [Nocardioides rubriscoriae]
MQITDPGIPTWPVTGLSLVVGFAVAELTGVRAIGGVVLVVAMLWCGVTWLSRQVPGPRIAAMVVLYLVLFALSHVIADPLGTWPSVALVAAVMAAATYAVADRTHPRTGERVTV